LLRALGPRSWGEEVPGQESNRREMEKQLRGRDRNREKWIETGEWGEKQRERWRERNRDRRIQR
jgi:hypothetical protein